MKNVVLLGSTGSIGTQAAAIIRRNRSDFSAVGLAAKGGNIEILRRQTVALKPHVVAIFDEEKAAEAKKTFPSQVKVLTGMDGILELCHYQGADTILNAMVGMIGLRPTLETLNSGKTLLLANKESLVAGGKLVMKLVDNGAEMIPVDSEHSGIFMCLRGNRMEEVERVTIFASGGPFRGQKMWELRDKTPEDALKHPNWSMGKTITIQSATLANKAREVIETMWMYHLKLDQVKVLIEKSSTFHASVLFRDGAEMAQMASPSMEIPIQYALYYPRRPKNDAVRLNLSGRNICFEEPDRVTFKSLMLGEMAIQEGGTLPVVFNAADERAVELFLDRKIKFLQISQLTEAVMRMHNIQRQNNDPVTLENVLRVDAWARDMVAAIATNPARV